MGPNTEQGKNLSKWLIGTATVCILIYLGVKNMNVVAAALTFIFTLSTNIISFHSFIKRFS